MAIDTEGKRRSALRMALPVPNASVNAPDRAQVTWNYSGLAAAVASVGAIIRAVETLIPQPVAVEAMVAEPRAVETLIPDIDSIEEL